WKISPGMILILDKGTQFEEQVLVTGVDNMATPPTMTVQSLLDPTSPLAYTHPDPQNFPATTIQVYFVPGNPGPQPQLEGQPQNPQSPRETRSSLFIKVIADGVCGSALQID